MTPRPDDDLERLLARSLREEGERIVPSDRLDAILDRANAPDVAEVRPLHSWRSVLAAAAAAAVVAGSFWALGSRPDTQVAGPPTTSSASVTTPGESATTSSAPVAERARSVPVYFVGRDGGSRTEAVLVRVFDRVVLSGVEGPADRQTEIDSALRLATTNSATADGIGPAATVDGPLVTRVVDGDVVVVELGWTPSVGSSESARELLAAWVRTVQGVLGRGDLPVRFSPADGAPLFGHLEATRDWRQADIAATPLASIWIDDPSGSVGPEVTARGVASVFEAALLWELLRDGSVVDSGSTMASEGAPGRGTWQVRLTGLEPGAYELRVFAGSPKDGSVAAERRSGFTVTGS